MLLALPNVRRRNVRIENLVLLVEDDAPLKRSLEKFLNQAGYAYESCSTAREALTLAEKLRHDVVIVEYHLPDSNGTSLLEKLKLHAPKAAAIVLSEYDFQAVATDLNRARIEFYLKKPFDLVDLETALSSACVKAGRPAQDEDWNGADSRGVLASTSTEGNLGNGNSTASS